MTDIEALPRLLGRRERVRPTERVAFLRDHAPEIVLGLEVWCLFAGYLIWRTVAGPAWIWQDSRARALQSVGAGYGVKTVGLVNERLELL